MDKWYPEYEKLLVGVITKDKDELHKYANLFKVLLDHTTATVRAMDNMVKIETRNAILKFITRHNMNQLRGWKNHYVIDLVNDEEFHRNYALICTNIHDYLKEDERWKDLFN